MAFNDLFCILSQCKIPNPTNNLPLLRHWPEISVQIARARLEPEQAIEENTPDTPAAKQAVS
jgi:hypothetical protein